MRVYRIQNSNLVQAEQQIPEINDSEVLIKVRAISLNFRDLILLEKNIENRVPTSDAAGEIIAVGSKVNSLRKGDYVTTLIVPNWQNGKLTSEKLKGALGSSERDGVLAEYIILPETDMVKFPEYLSFVEASTLPVAGLTAWNAVVENSNGKLGDTILIVGTGGVSLFALQFAKYSGFKIIMTSSSDKKLEKLKQMGAHFTLNYISNKDWINDVLEYTSGEGVDQIIDVVGGSHLNSSIKCVKNEGIVKMVGILGGSMGMINTSEIMLKAIRIQGIETGSKEMYQRMLSAIATHKIKPSIDKVFQFEDAKDAFAYLKSAKHFGKVCIEIN